MDTKGINLTAPKILPSILSIAITGVLSCTTQSAHAILITFDDLTETLPCTVESCDPTPVINQYATLGVTFSGAALYSYAPSTQLATPPNGLNDFYGPGMSIYFTGSLPTTVSFYISSSDEDAPDALAVGPKGVVGNFQGNGWLGTEENSTPYHDKQFVSFAGSEISRIDLGAFYNRRGSVIIDNLEFSNVPLPSGLSLLASGMGCLLLSRLRTQSRQYQCQ